MAKKYFQKALSVGLSLALCLGLAAPAFATGGEPQSPTVDELVNAANSARTDADTAKGSGDTAKTNTETAGGQAIDAATKAGSAENKANELNGKTTSITDATTKAEDGIKDVKSEDIESAVNGVNGVIEKVETETNGKIGDLNAKTEETVNGKDGEIAAASAEIDKISGNVTTQLDAAKEALETAKAEGATEADKQNAIDAAQNAVDTAEAAKDLVDAEVEKAEAAKNAAADAVEQAQRDYDALIEAANEQIAEGTKEQQAAIKAAQDKLTAAQNELNSAAQAKAEAEALASELTDMVADAKTNAANAAKTNAETAKGNAQDAYGKAAAAETNAQNTINQIDTKLGELGTEKSTAESTKDEKDIALEQAKDDQKNDEDWLNDPNHSQTVFEKAKNDAQTVQDTAVNKRDGADHDFVNAHGTLWGGDDRDEYNRKLDAFWMETDKETRNQNLNEFLDFLKGHMLPGEENFPASTYKTFVNCLKSEAAARDALDDAKANVALREQKETDVANRAITIGTLTREIGELETIISNLEEDIGKLGAAKLVAEAAKTTATSTKTQAQSDITAAQEAAQKAAEAIGKLNAAKGKLEAARQAQAEYQVAQDKVTELQNALNALKAQMNTPTYTELQEQKDLEADLNAAIAKADQAKLDADTAKEKAQKALEEANDIEIPEPAPAGGGAGDTGDTDVTIDDEAVPLASGPVTCAQFVDYLWRHEGSPEAESELFADHEYAPAIAWALSAELIDETFQPDELVTGADVRAILDNFARVFGTNAVAVADLTTLTGDDGEAVLNCDEVLAEFFGEAYLRPEDLDNLEIDDAA